MLGDAAAAGRVEQKAVGANASVPAMRVCTLSVLAAPSSRALIHIFAGPINPFKASWTRPIWGAPLVGVTQELRARLTVVNAPGQASPSAAHLLRPEPGQRGRTFASAQLPKAVTEARGVRVAEIGRAHV